MSSRCLEMLALGLAMTVATGAVAADAAGPQRVLRVCAEPDNMPYSRRDLSGFENRIAAIVADALGARVEYDWLPQVRGYVRKTMGQGLCDVFIGVPAGFDRVLTTRPYYRSSYVFLWRRGEDAPHSFGDRRIAQRPVGVQLVGDDLAATPPGHALARVGAVQNVVGYTVHGHGPAAQRMVDALVAGDIDSALVWGPQAGYFARRAAAPIALAIAQPPAGLPAPFQFAMAMGVARGNQSLRDELNQALAQRRAEIDAVLADYGVPRTDTDFATPPETAP